VGGTGIFQTLMIAPGRLRRFHPSVLVYQIYVGNDLFDVRYPVSWRRLSIARNVYWTAANHLRSLARADRRVPVRS